MKDDIYELLAEALDHLPNGFPRTMSGIEIKILKRIFSPEEAYVASKLGRKHERFDLIAKRAQLPAEQVKTQLITMEKRGLVAHDSSREAFRLEPWVIGIYEAQIDQMDHSFAHLVEEYFSQGGIEGIMKPFPALHRVVPARNSTKSEWVLPYDDIKAMLESSHVFNVRKCICRVQQDFIGRRCDFPLEICFNFSAHDRPQRPGDISKEEALALLDKAEETGLVHTVSNVVKGVHYVCNCCSCCCAILRGVKEWGIEQSVAHSNYYTTVDSFNCTGCGICANRCQMNAITVNNNIATVNQKQCIGCGLCVTGCPNGAAQLHLKPEDKIVHPPIDFEKWEQERLRSRNIRETNDNG